MLNTIDWLDEKRTNPQTVTRSRSIGVACIPIWIALAVAFLFGPVDSAARQRVTFLLANQTAREPATASPPSTSVTLTAAVTVQLDRAFVASTEVLIGVAGTLDREDYSDIRPRIAPPGQISLTFPVGVTTRDIQVDLVQDNLYEGTEQMVFSIQTDRKWEIGDNPTHTLTISDHDKITIERNRYATWPFGKNRYKTAPEEDLPLWVDGLDRNWFSGEELPRPIRFGVRAVDAGTTVLCERLTMVFKVETGSLRQKTVSMMPDDSTSTTPTRCEFEAHWRLGEGVGTQALLASIGEAKALPVVANSRQSAELFVGLALPMLESSYLAQRKTTETVIVETTPEPGRTETRTEVILTADSTKVELLREWNPWVGASFALHPRVKWLRLSAGVSVTHPLRRFYAGLSLSQIFWGWQSNESTPVDVTFGFRIDRRDSFRSNPEKDTEICDGGKLSCTKAELKMTPYLSVNLNVKLATVASAILGFGK